MSFLLPLCVVRNLQKGNIGCKYSFRFDHDSFCFDQLIHFILALRFLQKNPIINKISTADKDLTREVGDEFCTNSIIKKISFTGSTPVGKLLMKLCSDTVKR